MNYELKQELMRYDLDINEKIKEAIIIEDKIYEIPKELQEFFAAINNETLREGPHIFYDRYNEGERFDYNTLYLTTDEIDLEEYEFYGNVPYVLFARNGQYSLYLLRLDDENSENPVIYYLDAGDYEEKPHELSNVNREALRLIEFFRISSPIGK